MSDAAIRDALLKSKTISSGKQPINREVYKKTTLSRLNAVLARRATFKGTAVVSR